MPFTRTFLAKGNSLSYGCRTALFGDSSRLDDETCAYNIVTLSATLHQHWPMIGVVMDDGDGLGSCGGDYAHEVAQIIMTSGTYAESCEVVLRWRGDN
jgi:hypothetical protein